MFDTESESGFAASGTSGLAELASKRLPPTSDWSEMSRTDHFVQFYETDAAIVNSVAEYVIHGLRSGGTCLIVATNEHTVEIERIVGDYGVDLETARKNGNYVQLEANETLSKFLIWGLPDPTVFSQSVGRIVGEVSKRDGDLYVFGEMVGLLCAWENYDAAISLEFLWNDLRKKYPFSLFCAYPMAGIKDGAPAERMAEICKAHSRVIPDESYTALASSDERLRKIAMLQQRAKQLEAELFELKGRNARKRLAPSAS